jgi:hypothetical protein
MATPDGPTAKHGPPSTMSTPTRRPSTGTGKVAPTSPPASSPASTPPRPAPRRPRLTWSRPRDARCWTCSFLYRLTRRSDGTAEYTGTGERLALARADGIRLWIDGTEAPADRASWHYPLDPGVLRFAVEYGGGEARREFTVKVKGIDGLTVVAGPGLPPLERVDPVVRRLADADRGSDHQGRQGHHRQDVYEQRPFGRLGPTASVAEGLRRAGRTAVSVGLPLPAGACSARTRHRRNADGRARGVRSRPSGECYA